jgi:DNA-directed RNA polymerase subunit RPC12/RpoP
MLHVASEPRLSFQCAYCDQIAFPGAIVNSEAGCTACSQPRVLKSLFPVTKGYELKIYECASCGSDLWLVTRVTKSLARKPPRGRLPSGPRFKTIDTALKRAARAAAAPKLKGRPPA